MDISFALMSGGQGKRFGSDKTKACLAGKSLFTYGLELGLKVSSDVMHISRNIIKYEPFIEGVRYLSDEYPSMCPMAGLLTAGNNATFDHVFVLSADTPLFDIKLVDYFKEIILEYDAVIPSVNGKYYTLAGLYSKKMLLGFKQFYQRGEYKIISSLKSFNILYPNDADLSSICHLETSFLNINTKDDLEKASKIDKML